MFKDIVSTWDSLYPSDLKCSSPAEKSSQRSTNGKETVKSCWWRRRLACNGGPAQPVDWSGTSPATEPSWKAARSAPRCRQYPPVLGRGGGWCETGVCVCVCACMELVILRSNIESVAPPPPSPPSWSSSSPNVYQQAPALVLAHCVGRYCLKANSKRKIETLFFF